MQPYQPRDRYSSIQQGNHSVCVKKKRGSVEIQHQHDNRFKLKNWNLIQISGKYVTEMKPLDQCIQKYLIS